MQVPRVVEKQTPYTYTVRSPRVVVTKVPLDPCGNPIPAAPAAPASSAKPVPAPAAVAPAAAFSAADASPMKTFSSERPAAEPKAAEGWGASDLRHVDPGAASAPAAGRYTAEKPAAEPPTPELRKIEAIPAPAAKEPPAAPTQEPTIAPAGPSVYPPPPANDTRDVPAAKTSGRPWNSGAAAGHTT
jgi:translation initiation factor IF-2